MNLDAQLFGLSELEATDSSWGDLVASRVNRSWRQDEWNSELLLFTAILDSGKTRAFLCITPDCGLASRTSGRRCSDCAHQFKSHTGDPDDFRRQSLAQKAWVDEVLPRCQVKNGTQACARTAQTHDMCSSHWSKWSKARRRGVTLESFMSQNTSVYRRLPDCQVLGCPHQSVVARSLLCSTHRGQLQVQARNRGLSVEDNTISFVSTARPLVRSHQFSLAGMSEVLKNEFLFVLQQRDEIARLDPHIVRTVQDFMSRSGFKSFFDIKDEEISCFPRMSNQQRSFLRYSKLVLKRLRYSSDGFDGRDGDVWDSAVLGLFTSSERTHRLVRGSLDFTTIGVPWLKDVVKDWILQDEPDARAAKKVIRAASVASFELLARPGGHDASKLGVADMTAVVDGLNQLKQSDGKPYSFNTKLEHLFRFRQALDFGRSTKHMRVVPLDFSLGIRHIIVKEESEAEVLGKSLPDSVIRLLDSKLEDFRPILKRSIQGWSDEDVSDLYQTCYLILRNTGRRLSEVFKLKRDCLRYRGQDAFLIYTNFKRKRKDRWLPIDKDSAEIIAKWQSHVNELPAQEFTHEWLFPSPGLRVSREGHYNPSAFINAFNKWKVTAIEQHAAESMDPKDTHLIDPKRVTSRAFRHTYAQRHADAGTPVDVLRELMDHKSIETTMGYYQVSLKRKKEAVGLVAPLVVDRRGNRYPEFDAVAYELRSVAVPFGNCTEPTNVKAAGDACPLKFQCAGCDFYRPDPSFIPAVDEHIAKLRTEREAAMAVGAAEWVVRNYDDQIAAFKSVSVLMEGLLSELTDEQREAVEEAATVLRKTRAGRTFIPLEKLSVRHANE